MKNINYNSKKIQIICINKQFKTISKVNINKNIWLQVKRCDSKYIKFLEITGNVIKIKEFNKGFCPIVIQL